MKKISIISNHRGMNGSVIGLLDFQQYLHDYEKYNIKFLCNKVHINRNIVKQSYRKYSFNDIDTIKEINYIKHCIVTDFKSLVTTFIDGKRIIADKGIVLDNLELTLFLNEREGAMFYPNINMYDCLNFHRFKEIIFLMPPSNKVIWDKKYSDLSSYVFYKKINTNMLKNIDYKNNGKIFFRSHNFYNLPDIGYLNISEFIRDKYPNSIELSIVNDYNIFDFSGYIYNKKPEVSYYEQFGRLIFEFILLNKKIYWFDNPYEWNDGLKDYLLYYSEDREKIEYMMNKKYNVRPWE